MSFLPEKRITAVEALHHPYFQQFKLYPSQTDSELMPHTELTLSTLSDTSDLSDNEELEGLYHKFKDESNKDLIT